MLDRGQVKEFNKPARNKGKENILRECPDGHDGTVTQALCAIIEDEEEMRLGRYTEGNDQVRSGLLK